MKQGETNRPGSGLAGETRWFHRLLSREEMQRRGVVKERVKRESSG